MILILEQQRLQAMKSSSPADMLSISPGIECKSRALLIPPGSSPLLGAPFTYCRDWRLNVANAQDTSDMFAWVSRPGMPPEESTCFCHTSHLRIPSLVTICL